MTVRLSDKAGKGSQSALRIASEDKEAIDRWAELLSDYCSPILVKEVRQALKSREFFWTYFLLLAAVSIWTMIGVTATRNVATNVGTLLLSGYWVILGVPLGLVIPFGAYRSLTREFEDGTIQLISVTTLKPWQILFGKLTSSVLQLVVYLSVLGPCITFTYLLQGVSMPEIFAGLAVCLIGSLALCCVALFFASMTRTRAFSIAGSILLLIILLGAVAFWITASVELTSGSIGVFESEEGQLAICGICGFMFTTGLLAITAASSLISFAADNRSTLPRMAMLVQQTIFIGFCFTVYTLHSPGKEQVSTSIFVASHYWLLMGLLLVGESSELSNRVRRWIPQRLISRAIASYFLPGGGRGLLFTVCNICFCGLVLTTGAEMIERVPQTARFTQTGPTSGWSLINSVDQILGLIGLVLYPTFFLSATYLFCCSLRRLRFQINSATSLFIGFLGAGLLTSMALVFHYNVLPRYWRDEHTAEQVVNWYWTCGELLYGTGRVNEFAVIVWYIVMFVVSALAIYRASGELLLASANKPERVMADDAELKQAAAREEDDETIDEIFAAPLEPQ